MRILAAAAMTFREKGYERATTREISARAGVATGTLFLYCRDKEDLLLRVYRERLRNILKRLRHTAIPVAADTSPQNRALWEERVYSLFPPFFRFYARDRATAAQFLRAQISAVGPDADAEAYEFLALMMNMLGTAQKAGVLRMDADLSATARAIFAIYLLFVTGWIRDGGPFDTWLAGLRSSLEIIWRGLSRE